MNPILRYLILLRVLLLAGVLGGLAMMASLYGVTVPWLTLATVFGVLIVATVWSLVDGLAEATRPFQLTLQLLFDVLALSVFVFVTGGSMNPFISLFVLPIVFAAATLPVSRAAIVAFAAVSSYTFLMFVHVPVDMHALHVSGADLHLWGMWYGFVLSAACIVVLVARMAREINLRDAALARAREDALRSDRIVALGALAAGTAHELGTPLSTLAVLTTDLEADVETSELKRRARLMRDAVAQCKESLSRLAADVGEVQAESGSAAPLDRFLEQLIDDWRRARPGVAVELEKQGPSPAPRIVTDRTVGLAIVNLLNNAADAAAKQIRVFSEWDDETLNLTVTDDGEGIDQNIVASAGREPVGRAGRGDGLGIGLYLSVSALNRLGGVVEFETPERGGTVAAVRIPIEPLRAQ